MLTSGLTRPWDIGIDDANVYWIDNSAMTVSKVGKDGGTPEVLTTTENMPQRMAVAAGRVYWTEALGTVKTVSVDGGTATDLADGGLSANYYYNKADSQNVYWTDYLAHGSILAAPLDGGPVETLQTGEYPIDLAWWQVSGLALLAGSRISATSTGPSARPARRGPSDSRPGTGRRRCHP